MKKDNLEKKNDDKEKKEGIMNKPIFNLIIGILIGAVITASVFLIIKPNNSKNRPDFSQFGNNGERVRPSGENGNFQGRSRRNYNATENNDSKSDDNKQLEDNQNEKQG